MKNIVLSYLLAKASAAEKHKEAMRADRAAKLPNLTAGANDAATGKIWTDAYIGKTDGKQKECLNTAVTDLNGKITKAEGVIKNLVADQAKALSETAKLATALAAKKTADGDVTTQDAGTMANLLKLDDVAQNKEFAMKDAWVTAHRVMVDAKGVYDKANAAKGIAVQAVIDGNAKKAEIATNLASSKTHYENADPSGEKNTYDADVILALKYKNQAICHKTSLTNAVGVQDATTGICTKTAGTPATVKTGTFCTANKALTTAADKLAATCQVSMEADVACAGGSGQFAMDTVTGACKCCTDGTALTVQTTLANNNQYRPLAGFQTEYDIRWAGYQTAISDKNWADMKYNYHNKALEKYREKVVLAEKDVGWIRAMSWPASLYGIKETALTKAKADDFKGTTAKSVYGSTAVDGTRDVKAWSIQYDTKTKLRLLSGDGTISEDYTVLGGIAGWITESAKLKAATGGANTFGGVTANGGLNLFYQDQTTASTKIKALVDAKAKVIDTTANGGGNVIGYVAARNLLRDAYKGVTDKYKIWALLTDDFTDLGGSKLCDAAVDSDTHEQAQAVTGADDAAKKVDCEAKCKAKMPWTADPVNFVIDKVVLMTAVAAAQASCSGWQYEDSSDTCKLIYGKIPVEKAATTGICKKRNKFGKSTEVTAIYTAWEKNVTFTYNTLGTGFATKAGAAADNKQKLFETEQVSYWNYYYYKSTAGSGTIGTGDAITADKEVQMEYYYLKALLKTMYLKTDIFSKGAIIDTSGTYTSSELTTGSPKTLAEQKRLADAAKDSAWGASISAANSFQKAQKELQDAKAAESLASKNMTDKDYAVVIGKKEMDNQKKLMDQLTQEQLDIYALVGYDGLTDTALGSATKPAASGLRQAETIATSNTLTKSEIYDKVSTGKKQLEAVALQAYKDEISKAAGTATNLSAELAKLVGFQGVAIAKDALYDTAVLNFDKAIKLQTNESDAITGFKTDKLAAIVKCQGEQYDLFYNALTKKLSDRKQKLETVEALLDGQKDKAPKKGKTGWRCEKALSNGTFRPMRGEKTCDATLCCGAGKHRDGNLMITVETCQLLAAKEYTYQPPRKPMATTMPATVKVPFTCITGAKKLAAAASALAAAVYMMA